jgi:uncharacterized lipoprotein YmbA
MKPLLAILMLLTLAGCTQREEVWVLYALDEDHSRVQFIPVDTFSSKPACQETRQAIMKKYEGHKAVCLPAGTNPN